MAQIAAEEFKGWECFGFGAVGIGSILPAEGEGVVGEGEQARIGDGRASDVSAQIFEGGSSRTLGLDMHAPVFAPDGRIHWPALIFKELVEVLTEGALQVGQINQELMVLDAHILALGIEPGARHQTVNMRMELQALIPGVKGRGESVDQGPEAFSSGEFFAQSARDGREEQIVGLLGEVAEEAAAQLGWEREGDQEV